MAHTNHVKQLVLTDINNTSACLNFVRKAPKYSVRPILGIDFRNGVAPCFLGIAKNNAGYHELNTFLSYHLHQDFPIPEQAPPFKNAFVVYPFEKVLTSGKHHFLDHEFIGVAIKDLRRLPFSRLKVHKDRLVVQQPVTFRNKRDFNAHCLLRAIDNNVLLSKLDKNELAVEETAQHLVKNGLLNSLLFYQGEYDHAEQEDGDGWVYILSTRESPNILKNRYDNPICFSAC